MAQIKAHEFERLISKGLPPQPIVLIYGPDRGLVAERAANLVTASKVDADDPFSAVRLDAVTVNSDPGRLVDEARAISLFGGLRLVRLLGAGNDRGVLEAVAELANNPPNDCLVVIEAGDLKKGTGLRKLVEEANAGLAVPCYADEGRSVNELIDSEMSAAELRLTSAARELLASLIGGDRLASRGEIQKLALYAQGKDVVQEEDVLAVIGDASALSVDAAVDAVLLGDVEALDLSLRRIMASKTSVFLALQSCLRQFQALETMRASVEQDGKPVGNVVAEQGRRVHFRRKPALEKALAAWRMDALGQALTHLQAAILETRRRPALEDAIARQALLALAVRSARAARLQRA